MVSEVWHSSRYEHTDGTKEDAEIQWRVCSRRNVSIRAKRWPPTPGTALSGQIQLTFRRGVTKFNHAIILWSHEQTNLYSSCRSQRRNHRSPAFVPRRK